MKTFSIIYLLLFFISWATSNYFMDLLPESCNILPRVRQDWNDLTENQRLVYARTVVQMKKLRDAWKSGSSSSQTSPLYNFFVQIYADSANADVWHGTSFFLPAHKWYLWIYESALIYTAYNNYAVVSIEKKEACNLTVPYWDWIIDYDDNSKDNGCPFPDESSLLDSKTIGSSTVAPNTYYVIDGLYYSDWNLTTAVTDSHYSSYPADLRLKRVFDCKNFPLTTGPSQAMNAILLNDQFKDFTLWLEGGPQSLPHLNIGMSLAGTSSPDEPIFWLLHANVDRLYHLWMDCHDYENVSPLDITNTQYQALNPVQGNSPIVNSYNGSIYQVTADTEIPYYWGYPSDSVIFPKPWPTPRLLWSSTNGYDGLDLRYGPDSLVLTFGDACIHNQQWNLVNYSIVQLSSDNSLSAKLKILSDTLHSEISSGRSYQEALSSMATSECENAPKINITTQLLDWINRNHLDISSFDTICDKISMRYHPASFEETSLNDAKIENSTTEEVAGFQSFMSFGSSVPLWIIITSAVGSSIFLIAVITLLYFLLRKRTVYSEDYAYIDYEETKKP